MSEITAVPLRPIAKGTMTRLWIGVAAAVMVAGGLAWAGTSATIATHGTAEQFLAWHKGQAGVTTTKTGLQYQVLRKGDGPISEDAMVAIVNYSGSLIDGKVFDKGERVPMELNAVVPGFSEALKLMNDGSKYRFWIPPALAYGDETRNPAIPAHSVLVFDVELTKAYTMAEVQALQQQQMLQQQGGIPSGPGSPDPRGGPGGR